MLEVYFFLCKLFNIALKTVFLYKTLPPFHLGEEKEFLDELGIPNIDIESLHPPSLGMLTVVCSHFPDCGYHKRAVCSVMCSLALAKLYKLWVIGHIV